MEPEEIELQDFEHCPTFETYKLLADLPCTLQRELLNRTVDIVGEEEDFIIYDVENRLFCAVEFEVDFTSQEIDARRLWNVEIEQRKIGRSKQFMLYSEKGFKPLKVRSQRMAAAGPNNNKICIVDGRVMQLEAEGNQEADRKSRLRDHFKNIRKDYHKIPGDVLVIHPNQNVCLTNMVQTHKKQTIKKLCLYNLDTRELDEIVDYNELLGRASLIDFGFNNTILLMHNGILFIYSLDEKCIEGVIYDNQYIPRSKFGALLGIEEIAAVGEFKRFEHSRQDRSFFIEGFHYSFERPEQILLRFNLSFLNEFGERDYSHGCGLFNTVNKQIMCGLTDEICLPFWKNSIKTYNLYDPRDLLPTQRDIVSMISWDMNDLNACLLIRIAHNWLNNKEPNRDEARSILSTLYHSENKWKLLLKSTNYIPELDLRVNPFKDIFYAIKRPEHTHITEVI